MKKAEEEVSKNRHKNKRIVLQVGELIAFPTGMKEKMNEVNKRIRDIRKEFLVEFGKMPPAIEYTLSDSVSHIGYGFELEGFANTYHLTDEVDYMLESKDEMHDRIYFYLRRFLRKWYMGCADMLLEEKLKDQAVVFEYGEQLVGIIESEDFLNELQKTKRQMGLSDFEWSFWESDYVADKELVVYVYGKDYFINELIPVGEDALSKDIILRDILEPILEENVGVL